MIASLFQKLIIPLVLSIAILCGVRYFLQPFTISTASMSDSLEEGEKTIVERIYRHKGKDIERFDLIALYPPFVDGKPYQENADLKTWLGNLTGLPGLKQDPIYVRRVIALPGETVAIAKDVGVLIDGKLLEESSFTKELPAKSVLSLKDIVLPDGTSPYSQSEEPITVPASHYFVLPDHRNSFAGSGQWGFVPETRIVGLVSYKYDLDYIEEIHRPKVVFANQKVDLNDQGVRALEENKFQRAIRYFNQALAIDENYDVAKDNLSIAYNNYAIHLHDKPEAAIDKLHKALFIDPNNELTRTNLNKMLERSKLDPTQVKVRVELAEKAYSDKRLLDALVEYREAARIKIDNSISAKIEQLEAQNLFPKEIPGQSP